VLGTYVRNKGALKESITLLQNAGGVTKYDELGVLATICGDTQAVDDLLRRDRAISQRRYPSLDIGTTAGRMLTLKGATLLHVAAEFGQVEIAELLLDAGADVNAVALIDANGIGGQTPIFHAATQRGDFGVATVRLLVAKGATLSVRCRLPGHHERLEEVFEGTVLDYARLFPKSANPTIEFLSEERET
jgi:ankyrin repeat protein